MKVVIVDYGMGNVGSIANMVKKAGGNSIITSNHDEILKANKLILPGVGSFDTGMKNLNSYGLTEVLNKKVIDEKTPILGICLGMQLMTKSSEEGQEKGLGWVNAQTIKFHFPDSDKKLRVPHMGWNTISKQKDHAILKGMDVESTRFYFVHSFYVSCGEKQDVLLTSYYGFDFDAAFQVDNIVGVQFHPEKSHRFGMQLISNFLI
jgi:imidazole glycerol-phosphate synthase subunit HisH